MFSVPGVQSCGTASQATTNQLLGGARVRIDRTYRPSSLEQLGCPTCYIYCSKEIRPKKKHHLVHHPAISRTSWAFQRRPRTSMNDSNASKAETLAQMYQGFTKEFPEVKGITAKELHQLLEGPDAGNLVLVDVRTPGEQEVSRLPGPLMFTREDFERVKADYRDRQLITYCTAGYRSGKYANMLLAEGFNVRNLEGSILSWTHEGYPLVTGPNAEPTKRVHVFGEKWLIQGEGYEAVWYQHGQGAVATIKTALPKWLGGQK